MTTRSWDATIDGEEYGLTLADGERLRDLFNEIGEKGGSRAFEFTSMDGEHRILTITRSTKLRLEGSGDD